MQRVRYRIRYTLLPNKIQVKELPCAGLVRQEERILGVGCSKRETFLGVPDTNNNEK